MSSIAISVQNLGKCYKIQHQAARGVKNYRTLRESIGSALTAPLRKLTSGFKSQVSGLSSSLSSPSSISHLPSSSRSEDFWALRDVSFKVKKGEIIGVVGRNGAGKSTLLKLLSRITEPTKGRIELNGRVSSLLEVGTGFHPELTGRENIFLNGAILGMRRTEIRKQFDEIVAFAEVEKFLDTPVKRYSSGMYVRLAFAVAAHLEPDILILDEVLAVGDFQFQKKCLGKMQEVVGEKGRTIIFVTHDLGAFQTLCHRGLYLNSGIVQAEGNTTDIIDIYRQNTNNSRGAISNRKGNGTAQYESFYLATENGVPCEEYFMGDNLILHCTISFKEQLKFPILGFEIRNSLGELSAHVLNLDSKVLELGNGLLKITVKMSEVYLPPSRYTINLWAGDNQGATCDFLESVLSFTLTQGMRIKRGLPYPSTAKAFIQSTWSFDGHTGIVAT